MPLGFPVSPTSHLFPRGKCSPNTYWHHPPPSCYLFGRTLLHFGVCLRRQPVQGLFVNNLSINIWFWGKNSEFCTQAFGPARQQEMRDGSSAPGDCGGIWVERKAIGSRRAKSCEEEAAKGLWVWQCWHGAMVESPRPSVGTQARAFVQIFRLPGWSKSDAGLLPIQSNSAESNGAFCCCCFLLLPLNFFVNYPCQWNVLMRKSQLRKGQEMKSRADFKNNAQFYGVANSQCILRWKGKKSFTAFKQ